MILTTPKSWSDIKTALETWGLKSVVVIACGSCSAACQTGGTEALKKIVSNLKQEKIQVIASLVIEEPCDSRIVVHDLRLIDSEWHKADGLVVASCGMGAQTIAEITQKPTIITTDTIMMSQTERVGIYHEKCQACGNCVLNETGGICPISACPKSLLNGPCGGCIDGKCEVGNYMNPCAWVQIYDRLHESGHLNLFLKYRSPRDWSRFPEHRTLDYRKEMKTYYECSHE